MCQAAALQLGQAEAAGLRGRDHVVELVELLSAYSPNPARTSCWPARSTSLVAEELKVCVWIFDSQVSRCSPIKGIKRARLNAVDGDARWWRKGCAGPKPNPNPNRLKLPLEVKLGLTMHTLLYHTK